MTIVSKVSVIMPVFNGDKTIRLALQSLIYQTYSNWECIIVNDCSTDETKDILDSLSDSRFRVIHLKKNVGRGAARQVALDNSEGTYLTYLDADDFLHKDKLQKEVEFLDTNPEIELVACGQGSFNQEIQLMAVRGDIKKESIKFSFGDKLRFVPVTSMIRLQSAKPVKYNPYFNASEDVDYFSNYLDGKSYSVIKDVLYYYFEFESASYKKILEYTQFEFLRALSMISRVKLKALILAFIVAIKYCVYFFAIPFLGVNFFLRRRGRSPSKIEILTFTEQYHSLICNSGLSEKSTILFQ